MWALILEYGMPTVSWYAELALRSRVSMSAIGSVIVMAARGPSSPRFPVWAFGEVRDRGAVCSFAVCYQLDLVMPGSSPRCAISRKQIRHRPNLR